MSEPNSDSNSNAYDKSLFDQLKKALATSKIEGCSRSKSNSPNEKNSPQIKKESFDISSNNSIENKTHLI